MHSILPLDSTEATLETAGGKGANLARLARAGLPVPGGFLVTTAAYDAFVAANGLDPVIAGALAQLADPEPEALQQAADTIRDAFAAGQLPPGLAEALDVAYGTLAAAAAVVDLPVAVRSSATAEDLPDLSFAGQQDTILQVVGSAALRQAVIRCWSSLWTARALGYRARNQIPHADVSLAVVVQRMVPSQASGVLFTANPLTGRRTEMVIDATLGLGEALVAGQVEPDHFVVDVVNRHIVTRRLGAKAVSIVGQEGGGTRTVPVAASERAAVPDEVAWALVELGQQVAAQMGSPQDIEWGWADDKLWLLQSRPITSLFPLPERSGPPEALRVWFSFGAVQGMLAPVTPLGRDLLMGAFAGAGILFGMKRTRHTQRAVAVAGERLWMDVTDLVRHPLARRVVAAALPLVEPGGAEALAKLQQDPRLQPAPDWFRWRTMMRVGRFLGPTLWEVARTLRRPDVARHRVLGQAEVYATDFQFRLQQTRVLSQRLDLFDELVQRGFIMVLPLFLPVIAAGMASLNFLIRTARRLGPTAPEPLTLTRGLPHNVTTQMDLALWHTAQAIRADAEAAARLAQDGAADLAQAYLAGELPSAAQTVVAAFLERYGVRGVGEIDIGRPRWRENPEPVFSTLQSYVRIELNRAPDVQFARGVREARSAAADLAQAARERRPGRLRARLVVAAIRRLRALAGLRESPKFFMVRLFGALRQSLLASGAELAGAGYVRRPDDLFFLHLEELRQLAAAAEAGRPAGPEGDSWKSIVARRRADREREQRRRQIPRLLLSDGQAFFEGVTAQGAAGTLSGSPVSPGVAEGRVRVVFDPHRAGLEPGEILVCPGTDPAWTPLFLTAGGLIMEVGGMMTHGSVVAREYGIPAVVGVHQATSRLQTGQRVRLDGANGLIEPLPD